MRQKHPGARAGWAIASLSVARPSSRIAPAPPAKSTELEHVSCGRVVTTPGDPGYAGATQHTNNTGELTGLLEGAQRELCVDDGASVEFHTDSTYAMNIATGKWKPRQRNRELARRLNVTYARLRAQRGQDGIGVVHVRAHTRVPGNELVDKLAKLAADDPGFHGDDDTVKQRALREYAAASINQSLEPHAAPQRPPQARVSPRRTRPAKPSQAKPS